MSVALVAPGPAARPRRDERAPEDAWGWIERWGFDVPTTGRVERARRVCCRPHPSTFALRTIPATYLHDYCRAADEFGVGWTKLATIA